MQIGKISTLVLVCLIRFVAGIFFLFSPTNVVEIVLFFFKLYFICKFYFSVFFSFPPFKIPEAYFIRDPHTFLLTKDFIKVYMFFLVQKTPKALSRPELHVLTG